MLHSGTAGGGVKGGKQNHGSYNDKSMFCSSNGNTFRELIEATAASGAPSPDLLNRLVID
jgi:hypothetical protein